MCEVRRNKDDSLMFICSRSKRTNGVEKPINITFDCKLNNRSLNLLKKNHINNRNFKSWIITSQKMMYKQNKTGIRLITEEKAFSSVIYFPNDFIGKAIRLYKLYFKKGAK